MLLPVTQLGYLCCPTDLSLQTAIQQTLMELPSVPQPTLGAGDADPDSLLASEASQAGRVGALFGV